MKLSEIALYEEAAKDPVELSAVVDAFPKNAQKAVTALQRADRLTIGGLPWVDALAKMDSTVQKVAKREGDLTLEPMSAEVKGEWHDVEELEVDEMQEVYLGYNKRTKKFIVGYDCWIGQESAENAAEQAAIESIGKHGDEKEIRKLSDEIFKAVPSMVGLDFEVSMDPKGKITYEGPAHIPCTGGFYSFKGAGGTYKQFYKTNDDIIDIRLD